MRRYVVKSRGTRVILTLTTRLPRGPRSTRDRLMRGAQILRRITADIN